MNLSKRVNTMRKMSLLLKVEIRICPNYLTPASNESTHWYWISNLDKWVNSYLYTRKPWLQLKVEIGIYKNELAPTISVDTLVKAKNRISGSKRVDSYSDMGQLIQVNSHTNCAKLKFLNRSFCIKCNSQKSLSEYKRSQKGKKEPTLCTIFWISLKKSTNSPLISFIG